MPILHRVLNNPQHAKPIYVAGRCIGHVAGDTFRKTIRGRHHMLRSPHAIALDLGSIHDAQAGGARWAEIADLETGATYRAALDCVLHDGFRVDRGFGLQMALPLDQWQRPDLYDQLLLFPDLEAT